jgi:LDH2 family malate/lactate/ureidoglycolate dehydrogenase
MDYYARMALNDDMIGLATTNALPTMAPWGGRDKIVGINPLAVAIPAGEQHPIIFDAGSIRSSLRFSHPTRRRASTISTRREGSKRKSSRVIDATGFP